MVTYAEEDPIEDEAEVEGEDAVEEVAGSEDEEEAKSTASPDADTTILFVKPNVVGATQMGKDTFIHNKDSAYIHTVIMLSTM